MNNSLYDKISDVFFGIVKRGESVAKLKTKVNVHSILQQRVLRRKTHLRETSLLAEVFFLFALYGKRDLCQGSKLDVLSMRGGC